MSHYSSDYEYDAKLLRKERKTRLEQVLKESKKLLKTYKQLMPLRFIESLEDACNYLEIELKSYENL